MSEKERKEGPINVAKKQMEEANITNLPIKELGVNKPSNWAQGLHKKVVMKK
jgi:hypothetical protein